MAQKSIGLVPWQMLGKAITYKTFCFQDLKIPSRHDMAHFDTLVDLGLIAVAPPNARSVYRSEFQVRVDEPLDLFRVTPLGRAVGVTGQIEVPDRPWPPPLESVPAVETPRPSLQLRRRPAEGPWTHAARPRPTGTQRLRSEAGRLPVRPKTKSSKAVKVAQSQKPRRPKPAPA